MSSTPYQPVHFHRDSFVFGNVQNYMAELGQGGEPGMIEVDVSPAGQDAPRQENSPPFYIPEEDSTPHFVGEVGNWVLPQPRSEEQYQDSLFEPSTSYEDQEDLLFLSTPSTRLPGSQADLLPSTFSIQQPFPPTLSTSPAHLFSSSLTDSQEPFLPAAVLGALLPYSSNIPPAFVQSLPSIPSPIPSADVPEPLPHHALPHHEQATPPSISNADSPASSDVSSGVTSSIASSRASSRSSPRLHPPEYLPSIRYTAARRNAGVFCAQTYICRWGSCRTEIELQGHNKASEIAFHRVVEEHIDEHASSGGFDGRRVCRWDGECTTTGKHKDKRSMDRHIKTHLPWRYFCQHCGETYGRERMRHLRVCAAYKTKKAAGEVTE